MKQLTIYFLIAIALALSSCSNPVNKTTESNNSTPKTFVEVATVKTGSISNKLTFLGNTRYLKRNLVTASIPAFITQVNVSLGDNVNKGDLLYVLQSKESRALVNTISSIDSTLKNFGIINITASTSGIITTLEKQQPGDYVLEGTLLCTIAESNDLVFEVNVPYEYTSLTKKDRPCTIILPDNTKQTALFTKSLTAMNINAQTQTILAKSKQKIILPENMIVKVLVENNTTIKKQILPKSCVLSNEMMNKFWVMQLINDSIAIKVPVTIGNQNNENIEILTPQLDSKDRIISIGNYGLSDTALVSIQIPEQ